ncbi:IS66 family insertion sequence element accessory protein TnpB [Methylobacterium aquaticum]|nr:IS66 family insertion sequence element accessory protein TnpB [Methylobacterium aquaticum]
MPGRVTASSRSETSAEVAVGGGLLGAIGAGSLRHQTPSPPETSVSEVSADSLTALVQSHLGRDPFSGQAFVSRGRTGRPIMVLWWGGQGLRLFAERLETGCYVWPAPPVPRRR